MTGILAMILAGGENSHLFPLTLPRTKPALPFAGNYRLIDFALNNFVNADLMKIYVLTQFKSPSLNIHLRKAWRLTGFSNRFIEPVPAQHRMSKNWYCGDADAIYQNIRFIEKNMPEHVCIFGSDHIYKMDVQQMVDHHKKTGACLTIATIRVVKEQAYQFDIIEIDEHDRIIGITERPAVADAKTIPGDKKHVLASMGNYIFTADSLTQALHDDAQENHSSHSFNTDIIPKLCKTAQVMAYKLSDNTIPGEPKRAYWRDIDSIYSYWETHMQMLAPAAPFSLYNQDWPLHTYHPPLPAATFHDQGDLTCDIAQSMIGAGSYITGAKIKHSFLGFRSNIDAGAVINESILFDNVKVGAGSRLTRVIIDENTEIAPGTIIGEDRQADKKRFIVTDGIVIIPKNSRIGFNQI